MIIAPSRKEWLVLRRLVKHWICFVLHPKDTYKLTEPAVGFPFIAQENFTTDEADRMAAAFTEHARYVRKVEEKS